MSQPLLKHGLNKHSIERIAKSIQQASPEFNRENFTKVALKGLLALELRARIDHIGEAMTLCLPADFKQTAKILHKLIKHWDHGDSKDAYRGFAAWAVTDFSGKAGINHPKIALPLLQALTPLFSSEFAIRPYIEEHAEITWQYLHSCTEHPNEHVRRLASEGCRPRLPWGIRLHSLVKDPSAIIPVLDKLVDDNSEYVRRSVANNMNDIAKDHPQLVIKTCKRWQKNATSQRQWIIRHATRSLVKQGLPAVFPLLGYTSKPQISVARINLSTNKLAIGDSLTFSSKITSTAKCHQKIVVDFVIHYVKANGKTSPKVYKLKNLELTAGEIQELQKKQAFKPINTRRFYPGKHQLDLQINGVVLASRSFSLTA